MLRLPEGMRDRIKAAADENNRSMNAEIIARLESSFSAVSGTTAEVELVELQRRMLARLDGFVEQWNLKHHPKD